MANPTTPAPITACVKSALRGVLVENDLADKGVARAIARDNMAIRRCNSNLVVLQNTKRE